MSVDKKINTTQKTMNLIGIGIPLQIFGLIIVVINDSIDFEIQYLGEIGLMLFLVGVGLFVLGLILVGIKKD